MIVVADTSPLNYLILIESVEVLPKLYGRILVPPAVQEELLSPRAPAVVREWVQNPPAWLEVKAPLATLDLALDPGETAAIALAEEIRADLIMLDEALGRQAAIKRGLEVIGTLGILREAHRAGILDIRRALERLQATSFHISPQILAKTLKDFV